MKPRLLDLFCGAGGAAMGYHRAGFEVTGVDIEPHPDFPFEFIQADAMTFPLHGFTAIHASPPCQAFSLASTFHGKQAGHPDLVDPIRKRLVEAAVPWVIENVEGAPLRRDLVLCGEMFDLRVHRHRVFELGGFFMMRPPHQAHRLKGALHNCHIEAGHARLIAGNYANHPDACDAMGIDWMKRADLSQAIPPAYTEFIGRGLLGAIDMGMAA